MFSSVFTKKNILNFGLGTSLSIIISKCYVPLENDDVLYRIWDNKENNEIVDNPRYMHNSKRCNCNDKDRYKWALSPRIGNIGLKNPFTNAVKVKKDYKNKIIIDDVDLYFEYKIDNPSRLYFTFCESKKDFGDSLKYANSLFELILIPNVREKINPNKEFNKRIDEIFNGYIENAKNEDNNFKINDLSLIMIITILIIETLPFSIIIPFILKDVIIEKQIENTTLEKNYDKLLEDIKNDNILKEKMNEIGLSYSVSKSLSSI